MTPPLRSPLSSQALGSWTPKASPERIVLVSDICSSTKFVLDLQRHHQIQGWTRFLSAWAEEAGPSLRKHDAETYKFQGDGWIYFLRPTVSYVDFVLLLRELVASFYRTFDGHVRPRLSFRPNPKGLMFGADLGQLSEISLDGKQEWVGQPLNIACRLQSAIRHAPRGVKTDAWANQALLGPALDARWHPHDIPEQAKVHHVRRRLPGVAGFELKEVPKLSLLGRFNPAPGPRSSARKKA